jgi:hypothetical protein
LSHDIKLVERVGSSRKAHAVRPPVQLSLSGLQALRSRVGGLPESDRASKQSASSHISPPANCLFTPPSFEITCPYHSHTLSPASALPRTVCVPRAILRGGLTSAVTPGPVWSSSSCFVTAAVVSPSSYEELLGTRLLLLFVKLRRDLAWHTSNRAACRTALVAQGSTMDRREQSTHCKVSARHCVSRVGPWGQRVWN